jgi:hypothetical protein|tara:strand:- start:4957 stop:5142 length:186 start_codon:yes stop_codon:yes gene_type:complete
MKACNEINNILNNAQNEIQEICSKYSLTIESKNGVVFAIHHQKDKNSTWATQRQAISFAPF